MKKILLIDDEPSILEVTSLILKDFGYDVFDINTAVDIVNVVEDFKPDLVLLDISLPKKLGAKICKELKQKYDLPVVLFSAHADVKEIHEDCGADGIIYKPYDMADLLTTLNKFL